MNVSGAVRRYNEHLAEEEQMNRARIVLLLVCASGWLWAQQPGKSTTTGAGTSQKATSAANMGVYTPDKLQWGPAPDVLPAGAQLAVVEGDPMKPGPYTMRLKMPAGYKIAPHHHARREHVTVVSGEFKVGMGDKFDESMMNTFSSGSFAWLAPTVHHYAMAGPETVIQLHGTGPWEIVYINPSDDPRKTKK
jgi:quercetin dioxygenase-like cupin family protein